MQISSKSSEAQRLKPKRGPPVSLLLCILGLWLNRQKNGWKLGAGKFIKIVIVNLSLFSDFSQN